MRRRYKSLVGLVLIVFISGVSTGVDITFQIDMRYQPDFEPPIDFVGPRGNLTPLNWHKTLILSDSSNDSIYTGTASFDDTLVGSELYYKFVFGVDSCWAVTWEVPLSTAGASRNLEIPSNDATLPVTYFSDIDRPPISMNVTIRFNLDVTYFTQFVPDSIAIKGDMAPLNWDMGDGPYMEYLGNNLWQADVLFPAGTPPYVWYKYNPHDPIAGWTDEPIQSNRVFCIIDTALTQTLPVDYLGCLELAYAESSEYGPTVYAISQNYPNPFNSTTTIKYQLPKDGRVSLEIYNLTGQKIRTLADEKLLAGFYTASWDGTNSQGRTVVDGIYFYRITIKTGSDEADFISTKKLILLK